MAGKQMRYATPSERAMKQARERAYYYANHEKRKAKRRANMCHLARFSLTKKEYEDMLQKQGFCCAICGIESWATKNGILAVDHDHDTNVVRGLLCNSCNVGIGHLGDSPTRLIAAAAYLKEYVS